MSAVRHSDVTWVVRSAFSAFFAKTDIKRPDLAGRHAEGGGHRSVRVFPVGGSDAGLSRLPVEVGHFQSVGVFFVFFLVDEQDVQDI